MENDLESVWFVLEVYACAFFCDGKEEEKRERQREVSAQKHQQNSFIHFTRWLGHKKVREKKMKNENSSALKTHLPLALRSRWRQKSVFASWQTRVATWFIWPPLVFLSRLCVRLLSVCVFFLKKTQRSGGKKCWWLGKGAKRRKQSCVGFHFKIDLPIEKGISSFSPCACVCARVSLDKKAKNAFCFHNAPIDTVVIWKFLSFFSRAKSEKRTRAREFFRKKK